MVDEEIAVEKLRSINRYTDDLKQMRGESKQTYLDNVVTQRAVERTFMNLIQACIDLAHHIRSAENLSPNGTSKQAIEAIGHAEVISHETQVQLEEAVGFRNVLAHQYGNIDHDAVYDTLHTDLHWFERFQQEIAQWLQQYHSEE